MNTVHKKKKTNRLVIPSIIALGFIPLIVHENFYDNKLYEFDWYPANSDKTSDFFLSWKMITIIIVGIVMLGILLFQHFYKHKQLKFENAFYALFVYGMFVAMSALFSQYKHWVVYGTYQMKESVWVVLAYLLFCFYTYQCVQDESQVRCILTWSGIGIVLLTVLGTFQYIGLDFFKSKMGSMLIKNPSQWESLDNIQFNVPKHTVYATLYNQNYLSFYCGMLIPLILGLLVGSKKILHRLVLCIVEILCIVCMIGANSSSGWIGLAGSAVIVAFVLLSRKKKAWIASCIAAGAGVTAVILACIFTPLGTKVSTFFLGTPNDYAVRSIDTTAGCIEMQINEQILKVTYDFEESAGTVSIKCRDGNGNSLSTSPMEESEDYVSIIDDEAYMGCSLMPVMIDENTMALDIVVDGHDWYFTKDDEGEYCLFNQAAKKERYKSPEFSQLFHDNAFSNRGHIWDGVLPILAKYLFLGSGANTFMFVYPQNDYIYRAYHNMQNVLDVKAHSLYLQQWVENGLIGLCSFFVFCLVYLMNCIRIYRRADLKESNTWIGIGLFAGVMAYLVVGIANDSNVCTAPVFWILLGLGMAVNRMVAEKQKLIPEESANELDTLKEKVNYIKESKVTKQTNVVVKSNKIGTKKMSRRERKNKK